MPAPHPIGRDPAPTRALRQPTCGPVAATSPRSSSCARRCPTRPGTTSAAAGAAGAGRAPPAPPLPPPRPRLEGPAGPVGTTATTRPHHRPRVPERHSTSPVGSGAAPVPDLARSRRARASRSRHQFLLRQAHPAGHAEADAVPVIGAVGAESTTHFRRRRSHHALTPPGPPAGCSRTTSSPPVDEPFEGTRRTAPSGALFSAAAETPGPWVDPPAGDRATAPSVRSDGASVPRRGCPGTQASPVHHGRPDPDRPARSSPGHVARAGRRPEAAATAAAAPLPRCRLRLFRCSLDPGLRHAPLVSPRATPGRSWRPPPPPPSGACAQPFDRSTSFPSPATSLIATVGRRSRRRPTTSSPRGHGGADLPRALRRNWSTPST